MDNFFKSNLKYLRLTNGLKQEDLGKKLNKDYSTIGKWENGTRSPIMEDVIKLADIFNVDLKDFLLKDLRFNNSTELTNTHEYTEYNKDEKIKKILKDKGLIDEKENVKVEKIDRLIKIADMIDNIKKEED